MYDSSMKYKWDNQNVLDYARQEAKLEGILEGRLEGKLEGKIDGKLEGKIEGKLEGKIEGKLEGKMEGEYQKAIDIAKEMKREGIVPAQISKFTKLAIEEIEKL